jgi:cell division protein FtsB
MYYNEPKRRIRHIITPFLFLCVLIYFGYHLIQGRHGVVAYWQLKEELHKTQNKLTALQNEYDNLQHHVNMLHPDSICPDLLDEQARKILGYSSSNEIVVLNSNSL